MSDFKANKLGFDINGYMQETEKYMNLALDQLSIKVQDLMMREIMTNGNGSHVMRQTACQQVKEISRKIEGNLIELVVGIDEDALSGNFSDQVYVRTVVVLHGNVAAGPLAAIPGKMAWDKDVTNYRASEHVKNPYYLPDAMMQYERVAGFGADRKMLDNIMEHQINHVVKDFFDTLEKLMNSIDYSKYITVK